MLDICSVSAVPLFGISPNQKTYMNDTKVIRSNSIIADNKGTPPTPTPPPSGLPYHMINNPTTVNNYSIITSIFYRYYSFNGACCVSHTSTNTRLVML
jgi:hypothetical protein